MSTVPTRVYTPGLSPRMRMPIIAEKSGIGSSSSRLLRLRGFPRSSLVHFYDAREKFALLGLRHGLANLHRNPPGRVLVHDRAPRLSDEWNERNTPFPRRGPSLRPANHEKKPGQGLVVGGLPGPYRYHESSSGGKDTIIPMRTPDTAFACRCPLLTKRVKEPTTTAVDSEKRTERVVVVIQDTPSHRQNLKRRR